MERYAANRPSGAGRACTRPKRVLHNIKLSQQEEIAPGLFFAVDSEGNGRLHNNVAFFGYTGNWSTERRGHCVRARAWNGTGPKVSRLAEDRDAGYRALKALGRRFFRAGR